MITLLDELLLILWKIIKGCVLFCFYVFWEGLNFFFALIDLFFRKKNFKHKNNAALNLKRTFILFSSPFCKFFSGKIERSNLFRRWAFLAFGIFLIFYYNPPSHWGPWYFHQKGTASYYGTSFWYHLAANGKLFLPFSYTAAHKTLPFGTSLKVVNIDNGKYVFVTITDRGPFVDNRIIDLSDIAADALELKKDGTNRVKIFTRRKF